MKPWQTKLIVDLKAAEEAAEAVRGTGDGGTCNFDTAVIRPGRGWRTKQIEEVLTDGYVSNWYGRAIFVNIGSGQAAMRTRMAEAACDSLKAAGYDACVYYQMD